MSVEKYKALFSEIRELALQAGRQPYDVSLVVVTKFHPIEELLPLFEAGCTIAGESRVQELLEKLPQAPAGISWDFIGPLQRNKVKKIVGRVRFIHSVDNLSLAEEISKESHRQGICSHILLQANTSGEASKQGLTPEECLNLFPTIQALPGLKIEGLMTMAPLTEDENVIRHCFRALRSLRDELKKKYQVSLPHLSMGMSHDYKIAIEEGATLVRVGSKLW